MNNFHRDDDKAGTDKATDDSIIANPITPQTD